VRTRAGAERAAGRSGALLAAYLEELGGASRSLVQRAQLVLPRLLAHLRRQGVRDVRAAGEAHLVAFARHLATVQRKHGPEGATLSPGTQHCYLNAVRCFFAWLLRRGVILADPARELPVRKVVRLPRRVLSEAEARRLMQAPSPWSVVGQRDAALLEVLYGCGLRRGECVRLDVGDLDLGQGLALVRSGKGKKDRVVPLAGRAAAALDRYLRESRPELLENSRDGALFLSKYGRRLSASHLGAIVKKHAQAAGLKGPVFPHALRHSFATHLLKGKASIRHVQELLGHRGLNATAVYTRVLVEDLREVVARCHPRERRRRRR
jgi:integrase/recombinase XerD